jgi:hypothetical protein
MFIIKIENAEIVGDMVDHRAIFGASKSVTDEMLAEQGYVRVNLYKDHDRLTQRLVPCKPVLDSGLVYAMTVVDMTAEEVASDKESAMANIRAQRNQRLSATDWRYRRDLTTTANWDAYCQALRDLPSTIAASGQDPRTFTSWPHDPNWVPTEI